MRPYPYRSRQHAAVDRRRRVTERYARLVLAAFMRGEMDARTASARIRAARLRTRRYTP